MNTESANCPDCAAPRSITASQIQHTFTYGVGPDAVVLQCILPVWMCTVCGEQFVDEAGEWVREQTILQHRKELDEAH
jgi:rubredoxin